MIPDILSWGDSFDYPLQNKIKWSRNESDQHHDSLRSLDPSSLIINFAYEEEGESNVIGCRHALTLLYLLGLVSPSHHDTSKQEH